MGLVLLIACVNVADLLPHFLAEGVVLAVAGGALGVAMAYVGVDGVLALFGNALVRTRDIGVNGTAPAFGLGTSLAVGILVGAAPVLRTDTRELHESLKDGTRGQGAAPTVPGVLAGVAGGDRTRQPEHDSRDHDAHVVPCESRQRGEDAGEHEAPNGTPPGEAWQRHPVEVDTVRQKPDDARE
ncbi:MAG TPA: hypothetical protein VE173_15810, partial [Longimicrobiales bacterium]|nr:hypothetical protein [Longimicrobiales bacterium]